MFGTTLSGLPQTGGVPECYTNCTVFKIPEENVESGCASTSSTNTASQDWILYEENIYKKPAEKCCAVQKTKQLGTMKLVLVILLVVVLDATVVS